MVFCVCVRLERRRGEVRGERKEKTRIAGGFFSSFEMEKEKGEKTP